VAEVREPRAEAGGEARRREDDYWSLFTLLAPRLLLPPREFGDHLRGAQRELLLAARCLIDTAIERLDEPERRRVRRPTRIAVE
jgi:hypothetical protein